MRNGKAREMPGYYDIDDNGGIVDEHDDPQDLVSYWEANEQDWEINVQTEWE